VARCGKAFSRISSKQNNMTRFFTCPSSGNMVDCR
jgi:hypothetical protein